MTIFMIDSIMIGHHHAAGLVHQSLFRDGVRIREKKKNRTPGESLYLLS